MTSPQDDGSPNAFWSDLPPQNLLTQVNQTPTGAAQGGVYESVKRAIVTALREAVKSTQLQVNGQVPYVDLEYPLQQENYPGIWVQYSVTKAQRAGIGQEYTIWDTSANNGLGAWTPIQMWNINGRATLSIVALTNYDRDQLSDAVFAMLAFSRPPEVWTTQPGQDTKQHRALITTINDNPYVSLTVNTDILNTASQQVEIGVPWQPDQLAYTDAWSFDLHGQTQIQFMHDGAYTLSRIDVESSVLTNPAQQNQNDYPTLPPVGQGLGITNMTSRSLPRTL